jgi:hypothetical protein
MLLKKEKSASRGQVFRNSVLFLGMMSNFDKQPDNKPHLQEKQTSDEFNKDDWR